MDCPDRGKIATAQGGLTSSNSSGKIPQAASRNLSKQATAISWRLGANFECCRQPKRLLAQSFRSGTVRPLW